MSIFSESVRLLWSKNIPVNIFTIFKICCKCLCRILESVSIRKIKIYVKVNKVDIENPISSKFSSLLVDHPRWWVRFLKKSTPSKQDPYFLQIKPIHTFITSIRCKSCFTILYMRKFGTFLKGNLSSHEPSFLLNMIVLSSVLSIFEKKRAVSVGSLILRSYFFYCGLKGQRHEKSCSAEALGRWIRP